MMKMIIKRKGRVVIIKKEKKLKRRKGLPKIKCMVILRIAVMLISTGDNDITLAITMMTLGIRAEVIIVINVLLLLY